MILQEFRAKYPEYNNISDMDLVSNLHKKYYANIPFEDFSKQVGLIAASQSAVNKPSQPAAKPKREVFAGGYFGDDPRLSGVFSDNRSLNKSVMTGKDGAAAQPNPAASETLNRVLDDSKQVNTLQPGAKIVDGYRGILEVGAKRGYAGLGRVEAGAMKALADVTGSDTFTNIANALNSRADEIESGTVLRGSPVEGFSPDSIVQELPEAGANAISSIIQTAPALGAGALSGGSALPTIFATTGAQEYMQGRDSGLSPMQALARAVPMASFEVIGEKIGGIDKLTKALNAASTGNGFADLGMAMIASAVREQPGEQITTAGQFITDLSPTVGLNPNGTFNDYLKAAKDTALATALQGGAMGAGGMALNQLANKQIADTAQQNISNAQSADEAINSFNTITETLGASNVSPITQQPAAAVDSGALLTQLDINAGSPAGINAQPVPELGNVNDMGSGQDIASDVPVGVGTGQQFADLTDPILAEALQAADQVHTDDVLVAAPTKVNAPGENLYEERQEFSLDGNVIDTSAQVNNHVEEVNGAFDLTAGINSNDVLRPSTKSAGSEDGVGYATKSISIDALRQNLKSKLNERKVALPKEAKLESFEPIENSNVLFSNSKQADLKSTPQFNRSVFFSGGAGELIELKTASDQSEAKVLNDALVEYGLGENWKNAYETVDVPDSFLELGKEIQVAFGRDVRFVAPTDPKYDIFNGVQLSQAKKAVYINAKSNVNITAIAGHELYHSMERTRPDLHKWFKSQAAEYFVNFPEYKDKLNTLLQQGEQGYDDDTATNELLSDFTGDALSDPVFLKKLADNNPSKFQGLLRAVINFLSRAVSKLSNLASSKYILDVESLRDKLAIVLEAFSSNIPIEDAIQRADIREPLFSRKVEEEAETKVGRKRSLGLDPESDLDAFIRKSQNDQLRWLRQVDAIKERGGKITDQNNVYQAMERMSARAMTRTEDFYDKVVTPLLKEMQEAAITLDDLGDYMYALHAKERNFYIKGINPAFADSGYNDVGGSGMSDAEADEIVNRINGDEKAADYNRFSKQFRNWSEQNLNNLVEGGLLDAGQAAAMRQRFPNYVPLKGFENQDEVGGMLFQGAGFSNGKKLFQNALGRRSKADNPASYIIHSVAEGFLAKEKAHVGGYLERLIKDNPDDTLWTIDKPEKTPTLGKDGAGNPTVIEIDRGYDPDKEVRFIRDGKSVRIQLKDNLLARAYNNRGQKEIGAVLRMSASINSFLRQMWTQKNPVFPFVNMVRDVPSGMLYATGEGGFGLAGKLFKNLPGAWHTMWKHANGQSVKNEEWAKWLTEYRAAGGGIGYRMASDIEATMDKINTIQKKFGGLSVVQAISQGRYDKAVSRTLWVMYNKLVNEFIERLNNAFENMTRLAIYRAARESGMSAAEASRLSKNATVNFNRKGEDTESVRSLYLFANAAIQDVAKNKRSVADAPYRKQVQAILAGVAGLGFMLSALSDDDDDLEEENRNVNAIRFKIGDKTINIPLSYGLIGFQHYLGRSAHKVLNGEDISKQSLRLAGALFTNLTPINPIPNPDRPDVQNLIIGMTPTPLQFPIQVALNRNSFGSDMRPDYNDNPDAYKSFRGTRGSVYSFITEGLNEMTGGDKRKPGAIDVSPETLKAFIHFSLGGTGKFFADSASTVADLGDGRVGNVNKLPVINRFVSEQDITAYRARFYREAVDARDKLSLANKYRKDGNTALFKKNHKWIMTGRIGNQLWKQMSELRDQELMAKSNLHGNELDVKLRGIEKRQIDLSNRFHKMFKETEKRTQI